MRIRKFRKGDERQCSTMLLKSFHWYFKLKGSRWLRKKFSAACIAGDAKNGISLVAVDDGGIVGYCHAGISEYGAAYLSTIGISPGARHRGTGSRLLGELESRCRKSGVRKLWLMVTHINTEAIEFYSRHGYSREGMVRDLTLEGAHEVIMSKHF